MTRKGLNPSSKLPKTSLLSYTYGPLLFEARGNTDCPLAEILEGSWWQSGAELSSGIQVEGLQLRGVLLPDGQQGAAGTARRVRKAALKLGVLPARSAPLVHRSALKGKTRVLGWASFEGSRTKKTSQEDKSRLVQD